MLIIIPKSCKVKTVTVEYLVFGSTNNYLVSRKVIVPLLIDELEIEDWLEIREKFRK